jgi:ATP-dependent DNA helicase RecQ
VEEVAEALSLNGIRALPYHAGLDPKVRADTQDKFLMEDVEVIVATIAFGMGIDKPDVRYVIHHDVPKSMEGLLPGNRPQPGVMGAKVFV